jgi:hypothetical protein
MTALRDAICGPGSHPYQPRPDPRTAPQRLISATPSTLLALSATNPNSPTIGDLNGYVGSASAGGSSFREVRVYSRVSVSARLGTTKDKRKPAGCSFRRIGSRRFHRRRCRRYWFGWSFGGCGLVGCDVRLGPVYRWSGSVRGSRHACRRPPRRTFRSGLLLRSFYASASALQTLLISYDFSDSSRICCASAYAVG